MRCAAWLVVSLRKREGSRPRPFRAIGVPWVALGIGAVFLLLGIGALATTASGIPAALIFVTALTAVVTLYVLMMVPRLKNAKASNPGAKRAPEETIK